MQSIACVFLIRYKVNNLNYDSLTFVAKEEIEFFKLLKNLKHLRMLTY